MPRIPFFRLGAAPEKPELPALATSVPAVSLTGLAVGVDNLRHDVVLSTKFADATRAQIARQIARHGEVEGLLSAEAAQSAQGPSWLRSQVRVGETRAKTESSEWKAILAELHVAALNRAKKEGKIPVDLLARLAVTKFLRTEMNLQFAQVLERCRVLLKNYEGMRQQKAIECRERVNGFQVRKKIILRKTGQDLFETLREIEKETLARTRRSFFGEAKTAEVKTAEAKSADAKQEPGSAGLGSYGLFVNRLAFCDDGRDDYLCAEHYVMLGNWDRDPDRYGRMREIVSAFLRSVYGIEISGETIDGWMNVPENARALVGSGTPDESTAEGLAQQERLAA